MTVEQAQLAILLRGALLSVFERPCMVVAGGVAQEALKIDIPCDLNTDTAEYEELGRVLGAALSDGKIPKAIELNTGKEPHTFWCGTSLDEIEAEMAAGKGGWRQVAASDAKDGSAVMGRSEVVRGKIAVVTGGAQGFGAEIATGLARSGAVVFLADMNLEGAERMAREINAELGRTSALAARVDVSDEDSVAALFKRIALTVGGLDICISNAGVLKAGSVMEQSADDFRFVTDVNYTGFFLMTKHAGRTLRMQHSMAPRWLTDIIQINSKSGLEGSNRNGAYAGGKFGGIGLVQSFALELIEYGIKVNAICPGNFFDGPLWSDPDRGLFVQYLKANKVPGAKTVEEVKDFYEKKVPMQRGCTGADVMRALFYIIEQEYETGQALPVTGGQVMLR